MIATRYQPLDVLNQLHQQINQIFEGRPSHAADESSAVADWIPAADVQELADRFVLTFDLPGVALETIDVTMDRGILSVSGVRNAEAAQNAERARVERPYGRFHRRFTLPDTVDAASVRAAGRNGVLEVTIPKQPKAQPRRVEVAAA
jgi:HSP20 family protein